MTLAHRIDIQTLACALLAAALGVLTAVAPAAAVALVALFLIVALVFCFPVMTVVLLVIFTAIVPYSVQNRFGIAGGSGVPGLLLSDLLLLLGVVRALPSILHMRFRGGALIVIVGVSAFIVVAAAQLLHGVAAGHDVSKAGTEFRFLLGFSAVLLTVPIVADDTLRPRLFRGLAVVGLLLGLWGIFQWVAGVQFSSFAGDIGVRPGVTYSSATGQLQGGLYAFPVAILVALAVLLADEVRSLGANALLVVIVLLNAASLVLTFERTFWVATLVGALFIVARGGRLSRARALLWAPTLAVIFFAALSTLSPQTLPAARERLLSLSQHGSDPSVRYRLTEARHVMALIERDLVLGSGLGATVYWGRPYERVPARSFIFSHNGYLWLVWKLGILGAALIVVSILLSVSRRIRAPADGVHAAVGLGAQAALLMALIASITFPSFEFFSITSVMGILMGVCITTAPHPPEPQ